MPGRNGKDFAYDTGVLYFQDVLTVRVADFNPPSVTPYTGDNPVKNIQHIERDIKFKFTHSEKGQDHYTIMPNVVRVERHPRQTACVYGRRVAMLTTA